MDYQKIGYFLTTLRKEKNLTQNNLAEILNVTRQAVSRWETGESIPDVQTLVNLSQFYNITIDEILNGKIKDNIITQTEIENNDSINSFETTLNKVKKQNIIAFSIALIGLVLFYAFTWTTYYEGIGIAVQYVLLIVSFTIYFFGYRDLKDLIIKNYKYENDNYQTGFKYLKEATMIGIAIVLISLALSAPYGLFDIMYFQESIFFVSQFLLLAIVLSSLFILIIDKKYYDNFNVKKSIKMKSTSKKKFLFYIYLPITFIVINLILLDTNLIAIIIIGLLLIIIENMFNIVIEKDYLLLRISLILISINQIIFYVSSNQDTYYFMFNTFIILLIIGVTISIYYYIRYFNHYKKYTIVERIKYLCQLISSSVFFTSLLGIFGTAVPLCEPNYCNYHFNNTRIVSTAITMYILIDFLSRVIINKLNYKDDKLELTNEI